MWAYTQMQCIGADDEEILPLLQEVLCRLRLLRGLTESSSPLEPALFPDILVSA